MKRKLFTGSSIIMLVAMIIAIALINSAAVASREEKKEEGGDPKKKCFGDRPWLIAICSGVAAWLIDAVFDNYARPWYQRTMQNNPSYAQFIAE